MSEANLWNLARKHLDDFFLQRIETAIERGIPDLFYCSPTGVSGWIEGKYADKPVKETSKVRLKISIEQVAWHRSFSRFKGRVFILAKVSREIYLYRPEMAEKLISGVIYTDLKELSIASDWKSIKKALSEEGHECSTLI